MEGFVSGTAAATAEEGNSAASAKLCIAMDLPASDSSATCSICPMPIKADSASESLPGATELLASSAALVSVSVTLVTEVRHGCKHNQGKRQSYESRPWATDLNTMFPLYHRAALVYCGILDPCLCQTMSHGMDPCLEEFGDLDTLECMGPLWNDGLRMKSHEDLLVEYQE